MTIWILICTSGNIISTHFFTFILSKRPTCCSERTAYSWYLILKHKIGRFCAIITDILWRVNFNMKFTTIWLTIIYQVVLSKSKLYYKINERVFLWLPQVLCTHILYLTIKSKCSLYFNMMYISVHIVNIHFSIKKIKYN